MGPGDRRDRHCCNSQQRRRHPCGFVPSYIQKFQTKVDAKRVAGVVAVPNDLEVRLPGVDERPDPDIARDAVERIKSEPPFS